jgi:hypothetical protein
MTEVREELPKLVLQFTRAWEPLIFWMFYCFHCGWGMVLPPNQTSRLTRPCPCRPPDWFPPQKVGTPMPESFQLLIFVQSDHVHVLGNGIFKSLLIL